MNQDLGTDTYGNRVHLTNRPPMDGVKLAPVEPGIKNPWNNVKSSMKGMGKDSDKTVSHKWKKEGSDYMIEFRKTR